MKHSHIQKISRRQFIGFAAAGTLGLLLKPAPLQAASARNKSTSGAFLFVEAEGFDRRGGWEIDQQSMDQMGSPYLLAHGLGIPVADAVTGVTFPEAGKYRLWVRTKDWVAPWDAPGAPGKFQVLIDGTPVEEIFGTKGKEWHWHDGGIVNVGKNAKLALRDLTGFEGRCEALLFCKDTDFKPADDVSALTKFRRALLGIPEKPENGGEYDFVVIGGGLAGTCAAISAARQGVKVALIQDRPVLGGNASSEVRVWPEGNIKVAPFPHVGDIVKEILPPITKKNAKSKWYNTLNGTASENFDDELKLRIVQAEPLITLLNNYRANETITDGRQITGVVIQSTINGERKLIGGKVFADCTGDATVGFQAGADYEYSFETDNTLMGSTNLFNVLDASVEEQVLGCECKDKSALISQFEQGDFEQPFPRCPWALDLSDKPFPGRKNARGKRSKGLEWFANRWYWESGFDKDMVNDIERIRDHNLRAIYGAWDALKNVDGLYRNHRLGWVAFISGKRESRRLMGDVVLDANHFRKNEDWADKAFPCSWHIDIHSPRKDYQDGFEGNEFIADFTRGKEYSYKGNYWAPYRTLYSRNIDNLFMAGRNISVTQGGLGPVRVMCTTGMMGEIVGKAASLCVKNKIAPRGVYTDHMGALHALMQEPGASRKS